MSTTNVKTPPQKTSGPRWAVPAGLILLSLIPVLAGTGRVSELASGAVETAQNARFLESPLPVLIHIVGASIFTLLGAFQFASSPQRQSSVWHRRRGIILIPTALGTALGNEHTLYYNFRLCLATPLQTQWVVSIQKEYACVITKSFC